MVKKEKIKLKAKEEKKEKRLTQTRNLILLNALMVKKKKI